MDIHKKYTYLHYIYQISSIQELPTLQETKERKKNSYMISFYIQETSYMKMESKYCIMGSINDDKQ